MPSLEVPGKIFLLGEYGVLQGGQAVLACVRPGYRYVFQNGSPPHPDSPLGRFAKDSDATLLFSELESSSRAGLGGSTAELIAGVAEHLGRIPETKRLWVWYREQFPNASGADLVVQLEALRTKHALFLYDQGSAYFIEKAPVCKQIFVFQTQATQKVKTHENLNREMPDFDPSIFNSLSAKLKACFLKNDQAGLAVFREFSDVLRGLNLTTPFSDQVTGAFEKIPGVLGCKGCGAGLNDVFVVGVADAFIPKAESLLSAVAKECSLTELGNLADQLW